VKTKASPSDDQIILQLSIKLQRMPGFNRSRWLLLKLAAMSSKRGYQRGVRPFLKGKSTMQLPEQPLSLLLGLATGAPAGPLSSYIATIKRSLPLGSIGNSIEDIAHKITHTFWANRAQRNSKIIIHYTQASSTISCPI
jgi:hypothetical protein